MGRDIPGFFYDAEKNKYFKIQANHVAPPGAQYSKESVKKRRIEQEHHQKRVNLNERMSRERIQKASFLNHSLIDVGQELGLHALSPGAREEQRVRTYANQLHRKRLHKFDPWPDGFLIRHILRTPESGILIAGGHYGGESSLSTTMDSGPNGDSFITPQKMPDSDDCEDHGWPPYFPHNIRIRTTPSLWGSAACPSGPKALFAIGTSDGLHTLEGLESRWTLSQKPFPDDFHPPGDSSHANVTAVEWLSSNIIASGLKDSTIFLHDLRSGGSASRIQHTHSVFKIRKIDPYRLVVAGIQSLQMYDVRYAPNGLQHKPNPISCSHASTRPYLTFPGYTPHVIPEFDWLRVDSISSADA
ncbi:hypothetical protein NUU61_003451 [Penicillium alfredii]|uniref:Uncharacterized protein n=1 Tax=Penicillium alfredii TaxID=1506179 RepID=A0A9W9FJA1_9EURO|nr:uncharacterized protein NUU61_003451 [Penicillium alfredii]KAJ5101229.1 hypothetical protein NUU61_003451 [Penicillium alfredii]